MFALLAALALVGLLLLGGTLAAAAQSGGQERERRPPTLCQEHAGRPGWDAVCREARRH